MKSGKERKQKRKLKRFLVWKKRQEERKIFSDAWERISEQDWEIYEKKLESKGR